MKLYRAPHFILNPRTGRIIHYARIPVFIDIAVPRDIDPEM
jgi:glutamyl-tRNA reductase